MALSDTQIAQAAAAGGFTGNDQIIAVAVGLAESGGNASATHHNSNGTIDYGLMQINSVHSALIASGTWSNPNDNMRMAKSVKDSSGWKAWTTFSTGAYLVYYSRAAAAVKKAGNAPASTPASVPTQPVGFTPGAGLAPLGDFLKFLVNPNSWRRIGMMVIGSLMLMFALFKMTGDNRLSGTTKAIAGAAAKAAGTAALA